jgi:hypothetical protein
MKSIFKSGLYVQILTQMILGEIRNRLWVEWTVKYAGLRISLRTPCIGGYRLGLIVTLGYVVTACKCHYITRRLLFLSEMWNCVAVTVYVPSCGVCVCVHIYVSPDVSVYVCVGLHVGCVPLFR